MTMRGKQAMGCFMGGFTAWQFRGYCTCHRYALCLTNITLLNVAIQGGGGAFTLANNINKTVLNDGSLQDLGINFAPLVAGPYTATLEIFTDQYADFGKTGAEYTLNLQGSGLPFPEPATWAMMLTGFGLIGATVRSRRSWRQSNFPISVADAWDLE